MKKKGCLIPVLIVVVALAVGIGVGVSQMTNNPGSTNKETVPVVFDALQYEVKDKKNISETELIEQLGEPDRTEDWNYTPASEKPFPFVLCTMGIMNIASTMTTFSGLLCTINFPIPARMIFFQCLI